MALERYFFVVALSHELRRGDVLSRKLFGQPIVLFRDGNGRATALLDRCCHRNFPLSTGTVVDGGLRCNYHGWEYDGDGRCRCVPGLDDTHKLPKARVPAFATVEQDGLVWVLGAPETEPIAAPVRLPIVSDTTYHTQMLSFGVVRCSVDRLLENFMDSMHPPYVHPGLLNDENKRQHIQLQLSKYEGPYGLGIDATYVGEKFFDDSLFMRWFGDKNADQVFHSERYLVPTQHQIEFRIGPSTHFLSTQFLTPEDDGSVRLHLLYHFKLKRLPRTLARIPFRQLIRKLIGQDIATLELQQAHIERFGGQEAFSSSKLDAMGLRMTQWMSQLRSGKPPSELEVPPLEFSLYI